MLLFAYYCTRDPGTCFVHMHEDLICLESHTSCWHLPVAPLWLPVGACELCVRLGKHWGLTKAPRSPTGFAQDPILAWLLPGSYVVSLMPLLVSPGSVSSISHLPQVFILESALGILTYLHLSNLELWAKHNFSSYMAKVERLSDIGIRLVSQPWKPCQLPTYRKLFSTKKEPLVTNLSLKPEAECMKPGLVFEQRSWSSSPRWWYLTLHTHHPTTVSALLGRGRIRCVTVCGRCFH